MLQSTLGWADSSPFFMLQRPRLSTLGTMMTISSKYRHGVRGWSSASTALPPGTWAYSDAWHRALFKGLVPKRSALAIRCAPVPGLPAENKGDDGVCAVF